MSSRLNRREFVAGTVASLGYLFTGPAFSVVKAQGANGRLRVAGIGVGGKGSSDIDHAGDLMDVVALCDIDEKFLAPKAKKWPKAKMVYASSKEALKRALPGIAVEVQANDADDIEYESLVKTVSKGTAAV